jgi:DNA-binding NarL/FixJ family response regulator
MKHAMPRKPTTDIQRVRVLLVDDHPAVREGLALLLAPEGIEVCAEAGSRADALAGLARFQPDIAIVDLSLDGEDGLILINDLHKHSVPALVYSMHNDSARIRGAIAACALGYVTKREVHDVLVRAIREVAAGRRFFSPVAAAALVESLTSPSAETDFEKLSPHERKVYELLAEGADAFDIAAALGVTNHTVESYYSRILVKLNLTGMHDLRRRAIAHLQKHTV